MNRCFVCEGSRRANPRGGDVGQGIGGVITGRRGARDATGGRGGVRGFAAGRLLVLVALLASGVWHASAQTVPSGSGPPSLIPGERVDIVRRFNYSVRRDGRYHGHVQREERTSLRHVGDGVYRGEQLATENTLRDLRVVASRVAERREVRMYFDGERLVRRDGATVWQGMPTLPVMLPDGSSAAFDAALVARIFLVESDGAASSGFGASRGGDVGGGDLVVAALPTVAAYRVGAVERYEEREVVRIDIGYRLRWPLSPIELQEHPAAGLFSDGELPPPGMRILGTHQGTILMPRGGGMPILHRTTIDERLMFADGTTEERNGFVLTWYRTAGRTDNLPSADAAPAIRDVRVERDNLDRLRLSIRNLQFVADQARLLPGENARLDQLAAYLNGVEDATILVTGHTADVGSAESQIQLAVERARYIVEALASRGVRPGRLRYEGVGGAQPVGDNTTEEGRAANRRVEITLLPD